MKVKVAKWGNSLGVRLPKAVIEAVGASVGSNLDLIVDKGELRLKTSPKTSRERFEEMIAEMKRLGPENEPETVDWGPDRGSEIIDDAYSRGEIRMPRATRRSADPVRRKATK